MVIRSEEEVSQSRIPFVTYFCPALDLPLGRSGRKTTTLVQDHEYFIHTKFHQNPSSGSREKAEYVLLCMYMHVCNNLFELNKCLKNSLKFFLCSNLNPCCAMVQYIGSRDYAPVDGGPIYWVCNGRHRNGASGS